MENHRNRRRVGRVGRARARRALMVQREQEFARVFNDQVMERRAQDQMVRDREEREQIERDIQKDARIRLEMDAWLERHERERREQMDREGREQRDRVQARAAYIEQNIRENERIRLARITLEREEQDRLYRDRDELGRTSMARWCAWEQERKLERIAAGGESVPGDG